MAAKILEPAASRWRDTEGGIVGARLYDMDGCRVHASGRQPRGFEVQVLRTGCCNMATLWRGLSLGGRAAWDQFGVDNPGTDKYGYEISWSGWNWFVRFNSRLYQLGASTIDSPPADPSSSYDPSYTLSYDGGAKTLLLGFNPAPALGEWLRIWRGLHRNLTAVACPWPLPFYRFVEGPAISPIIIAYLPGPFSVPEREWVAAQGGDSYGRVASVWSDFEDLS